MFCYQLNAAQQIDELLFGDEVVEVDADPPRFDPLAPCQDLLLETVRGLVVYSEQPVPVGSGAGTTAAGLNSQEVIEHGDDEVVVEILGAVADHERNDRQPLGRRIAENGDIGSGAPEGDRTSDELILPLADLSDPDLLLE